MQTFQKILYLETIEKHNSITSAAKELFLSQPYLSKFIKQTEEDIGITLFESNYHRTQLTYGGKRYLYYLKKIEEVEKQMTRELFLIGNNHKGEIILGINPGLASSLLGNVIPQFKKEHEGFHIKLIENNQNVSEQMVAKGELDLAVGMSPVCDDSKVSYSTIQKEELFLFVPKDSALFDVTNCGQISPFKQSLSLLENEPLILTPLEYGMGKTVARYYQKQHIKLNQVITTSTSPTAINLSLSGMGATFIPERLVSSYLDNKNCNIFRIDRLNLFAEYILIYSKDTSLSGPSIQLYNAFLKHH
ncbi:LysR family transcriptional regulator [Streptococcus ictaluri]|uniref:LysR substrate binding domain protein n=1 Tax=Streptococcus ictaluri 707-05 TaxID=764299 RepID=G5K1P3_9STRE|nr:LysR family transcriptional regulator [Streptococcus ictaluri]EHI70063.1 LysR substrate binding domain protein [Streptococcus ictaluri 707-05]